MAAGVLVALEEYLSRTYEPDMDYDDGVLIERNVGKRRHSRGQILIGRYICEREEQWGIIGYVEQRLQVAPRKFRVVDICASLATAPREEILVHPRSLQSRYSQKQTTSMTSRARQGWIWPWACNMSGLSILTQRVAGGTTLMAQCRSWNNRCCA